MTSKFEQFKDVALPVSSQSILQGGLTSTEALSLREAIKKGLGREEAFRIMVERMKDLQAKAIEKGDLKMAKIHEEERCKMELTLGRTW